MPQNAANLNIPVPPGAPENGLPDEAGKPLPFVVLPVIAQAQEAFHAALPGLLKERAGQWVAFHGERLLGFARTKTELYQTCLRQGYPRGQVLVRSIEPEIDVITLGPREVA
jgi:hypothetical protein